MNLYGVNQTLMYFVLVLCFQLHLMRHAIVTKKLGDLFLDHSLYKC